eukprot:CAMPEP_0172888764 /NCGR_PEP_ID=MMETSP1075-20121228/137208_1 /TAXON_ID=2916 /ORGANISM="Ceratium fusus, Strain PA161109" /LENGTH=71 /DNA_ID=CAMNT_0013742695 /DNA_START=313 /DNA_END=528 /DNA_ORIENTATION=-
MSNTPPRITALRLRMSATTPSATWCPRRARAAITAVLATSDNMMKGACCDGCVSGRLLACALDMLTKAEAA